MRSLVYSLIAALCLTAGLVPLAHAQTAFSSSDPSGTVSCSPSGTCTSITFTPIPSSDSYIFQNVCLSTTPISPVDASTVNGYNGGPCASYTGFNSTQFGACVQNWGGSCTLNVSSGGLAAGTYTVYIYIYYTYCPTADIVQGGCTVGSGGTGYPAVQTVTASGTIGSNNPPTNDSWVPGSWGTCSSSGTQTRSVTCQDSSGNIVSNSNCTSTEPATTQSCTPATNYTWVSGAWSACSAGTETRTVSCENSSNTVVSSSYCTSTEPAASQSCTSTTPVNSQDPTCTDPTCTAVNSGPGVTLPNCVPDPSQGKFCVVVPTKQ